ncbi:MAG: hypothetical protein M1399_00025 [Actinobacteria bacterium]|nr:hypothetical protein [Actinomycetota bacterium]MCL5446479.1 hypothetical protein [Actinomycetota bacterium]
MTSNGPSRRASGLSQTSSPVCTTTDGPLRDGVATDSPAVDTPTAPGTERAAITQFFYRVPRRRLMALATVVSFGAIFSRRPGAILHPQFFAEGGNVFYADAWNDGLRVLFRARGGYLHTLPRLAAAIAVHFPLSWGPSVFVAVAAAVQIAPVWYLLSRRFDNVLPNLTLRIGLCLIYVALPNTYGENLNIINADWHLAIVSFLLLFADAPRTRPGWARDLLVLALGGLSGPFAVLIWPVAIWRWWRERSSWTLTLLLSETMYALIQGMTILLTISSNKSIGAHLGATLNLFARIVAGQVVVGSMLGMNNYADIYKSHLWVHTPLPAAITLLAGVAVLWALAKGPDILRGLILFAGIILASSLKDPLISTTKPQWLVMLMPGVGTYYYLLPMLAWIAVLIWYLSRLASTVASHDRSRLPGSCNAATPTGIGLRDDPRLENEAGHFQVADAPLTGARSASRQLQDAGADPFRNRAKPRSRIIFVSVATFACLVTLSGIARDWSYPSYTPYNWSAAVSKLEHAKPGTKVTIPINPPGWSMTLDARKTGDAGTLDTSQRNG